MFDVRLEKGKSYCELLLSRNNETDLKNHTHTHTQRQTDIVSCSSAGVYSSSLPIPPHGRVCSATTLQFVINSVAADLSGLLWVKVGPI